MVLLIKWTELALIFLRVVEQVKSRLKANPVPMQLNIGAEENFEGVIDLLRMKAIYWDEKTQGANYELRDIPEDLKDQAQKLRDELVEVAAEANEDLMNQYLEDGELSIEAIKQGIRIRTIANEIVPVFCGSAFKNKGVQAVLDAVIDYLPSPIDIPPAQGEVEDQEEKITVKADDGESFSALAFKIATDPVCWNFGIFQSVFWCFTLR